MRVFLEGVFIGRATECDVKTLGRKVTVQITLVSDAELALVLAETIVAHTCTCEKATEEPDEHRSRSRIAAPDCPVHREEPDDG